MRVSGVAVTVAALFVLAGCGGKGEGPEAVGEDKAYHIAVIPKATAHPFWKAVHAGAVKAEQELGIAIDWIGAENENDQKQQIDIVQAFIARQVDAIVLAPLDDTALAKPVESAVQRGIPVVIIDSGLKSEAHSSFVATDNREGGRLGARCLAELMGGKGKAIMLRYNPGSAGTEEREEGFLEEIAGKFSGIEVVSSNQYGGVTRQLAMETAQSLLNEFGHDIQGIFCSTGPSSLGMLSALENAGKEGQIKFVGFDAPADLVQALREAKIHGLVVQDPFDIGYQGVKTAVQVLKGETVDKRITTRLNVVTPENVDTPEMKRLLERENTNM